jgi:hypothetical protein
MWFNDFQCKGNLFNHSILRKLDFFYFLFLVKLCCALKHNHDMICITSASWLICHWYFPGDYTSSCIANKNRKILVMFHSVLLGAQNTAWIHEKYLFGLKITFFSLTFKLKKTCFFFYKAQGLIWFYTFGSLKPKT